MKVAVVGCGGIGGVVAGALARKKLDVTCVEANEELARTLGERGITVERRGKVVTNPVRAIAVQKMGKERFDLIVVSVKNFDLRKALRDATPALAPGGFFLTIQNGLEILSIVKEDPSLRVVAGAVGFNSNMLELGKYRVTSEGGIAVGPLERTVSEAASVGGRRAPARAAPESRPNGGTPVSRAVGEIPGARSQPRSGREAGVLKELFEPEIPIEAVSSMEGVLWGKLLITCGVTGLGGVSGFLLGKLMKLGTARNLFYRIAKEGVEVAEKAGVRIEKLPGAVNPARFSCGSGGYPVPVRFLLLRLFGMKYKHLKSNIHHSLEKGNRTEIDYINGALVALGKAHGVPTPVNEEVVRVVKEIEAGKRSMGVENLREILSNVSASSAAARRIGR